MSARSKQEITINSDSTDDGFVCETHPFEDGTIVHYLHNPKTGEWKKSESCKK